MKVGIITSSYPSNPHHSEAAGGSFVIALRDAIAQRSEVDEVVVITQERPGVPVDDEGRIVYRYPWSSRERLLAYLSFSSVSDLIDGTRALFNGARLLGKVMDEHKIDIVFAPWAVPGGLQAMIACRKRRIPYSVWLLGSDIWKFRNCRWYRPILRTILKKAYLVYADGTDLIKTAEEWTGVRARFLSSTRIIPTESLPYTGLDPDKINLLTVSRLHWNKGLDILLKALGEIPRSRLEGYRLTMFGGGPEEEKLKRLIEELDLHGIVEMRGWANIEMVAALFKRADALLLPSRFESIPATLSEALQGGITPVVADTGQMGPLIRETKAGIVFPSNNEEALAETILKIDKNIRETYSEAGKNLYKKMFNLDENAELFVSEALKAIRTFEPV